MSPDPVTDGGVLTCSFTLQNYGNIDATDVVLTDTFDPAPATITVTVDGDPVAPAEYDYTTGVITAPIDTAPTLSITIPAATFTQDPATGAVTTDPGTVHITVAGAL